MQESGGKNRVSIHLMLEALSDIREDFKSFRDRTYKLEDSHCKTREEMIVINQRVEFIFNSLERTGQQIESIINYQQKSNEGLIKINLQLENLLKVEKSVEELKDAHKIKNFVIKIASSGGTYGVLAFVGAVVVSFCDHIKWVKSLFGG